MTVIALTVTCVVLEIGFRLLPDTVRGYGVDHSRFQRPAEFVRDRSVNSLGYHDIEPAERRPETVRILLLGDSYVEASSVSVQHTVGRQLEKYLNMSDPDSHQVISLGKSGWGQRQQYEALEQFGPRLKPDMVITVFLSLNDVRNNSEELTRLGLVHDRHVFTQRPGWSHLELEEAPCLFLKQSELNRFLSYKMAQLLARSRELASRGDIESIPFDYLVYRNGYDEAWERAWRRTGQLIAQTQALASALSADYYVVSASTPHGVKGQERGVKWLSRTYPAMTAHEWDLNQPDRRLSQICRGSGIAFVLLEPRFREETNRTGTPMHWRIDGHWNVEGNRFAGQVIAGFIRQQERSP